MELEPALFWGLGYNRVFDLKIGEVERKINTQFGFKTYLFNYMDVNVNANMYIFNREKFNILTNIGLEYKYSENTVHKANVFNSVISIMLGYFSTKWYIGTELMLKKSIAQYFLHSNFYKELYPEVQDGWYKPENSYLYFSLNTGLIIKNNFDINIRGGYRLSTTFELFEPYLIPAFINLSAFYRF